jgi:hypothetical protein
MRISLRDVLATIFVGVAVLIWAAWALEAPFLWLDAVPAIAAAILVLGVAASLSAVVPGFDELIHGSLVYLAVASALGVLALLAAVWAIINSEPAALAGLVASTVLLWAVSTMRHISAAGTLRVSHR